MSTGQATLEAVEFCARPFMRRLYTTLVVALAVFLATLVAFKQTFRGYLAETRLIGPAIEGLDLEEAADWIKKLDPKVAAVANRPAQTPGKVQLRITFVAMQPQAASARVDDLAERWLYQYLPNRLQAYRQSVLAETRTLATSAREREDQAHEVLEALRQQQLVQLQFKDNPEPVTAANPESPPHTTTPTPSRNALVQQLADLRLAIAALSSQRTNEHPRIRTLTLEAAALEQQLGLLPGQPLPPTNSPTGPQFVFLTKSRPAESRSLAELATKINNALAELSQAACDRQTAEFSLSQRMQELATQSTSVYWSKSSAVTITRLGGTPRCSTLVLAACLSIVAAVAIFRAGRFDLAACSLRSTSELASSLELPILGDLAYLRGFKTASAWKLLPPRRLQTLVRLSEATVAIAAGACLLAIAFEPSLANQVLADPFGALSEVLGRFGI